MKELGVWRTVCHVCGLVDVGAGVDPLACGLFEGTAAPVGLEEVEMRVCANGHCGSGEDRFGNHSAWKLVCE